MQMPRLMNRPCGFMRIAQRNHPYASQYISSEQVTLTVKPLLLSNSKNRCVSTQSSTVEWYPVFGSLPARTIWMPTATGVSVIICIAPRFLCELPITSALSFISFPLFRFLLVFLISLDSLKRHITYYSQDRFNCQARKTHETSNARTVTNL